MQKITTDYVEKKFGMKPTKIVKNRVFLTESETQPKSDLIAVQKDSFKGFIDEGIKEQLGETFPIEDFSGKRLVVNILNHWLEEPKISPYTARKKNGTYDSIIKGRVQLINKETGEIKEQDVLLGTIPLMTEKGSFIVNGIERVVVNQLVRSPGAFFGKSDTVIGKFNLKIIPKRGAWIEVETDKKGVLYAKIDRKRKFPVTQLLRVFGMSDKEMIKEFAVKGIGVESDHIHLTLEKDGSPSLAESIQSVYRKIRPGDLATVENAKTFIDEMFLTFGKYDFGVIARYKLNNRFNLTKSEEEKNRFFQIDEFKLMIKELIRLNTEGGEGDDIDHLSNRRVRSVGELISSKFRIGLSRMERIVKDRMTILEPDQLAPMQLINARPLSAALREFFVGSQLSQFMDQTNPMSELLHKRRLSAMGPGGLVRERAGFEVRDVHPSHYGRICPISTPEGPNIGLVLHFANYGRVNKYGFIETPYKLVKNTVKNGEEAIGRIIRKDDYGLKAGTIIDEKNLKTIKEEIISVTPYVSEDISFYDADAEQSFTVAEANSEIDEKGNFVKSIVSARKAGEPTTVPVFELTHIDITPKQIISEGTSLIPFLEHDDNTRASMGSNMIKQGVPLVTPDSPTVGTGMEGVVSEHTGQLFMAKGEGKVSYADARKIVVIYKDGEKIEYTLDNYERTNQGTAYHMKCKVSLGQEVVEGDILADGASIQGGEAATGRNLLVAYMTWKGFNYEDAIIISDKVRTDSLFDSVHIKEYTVDIRDTKLGAETMTRDIPNVSEAKLKDLDLDGIVRIGATVREGSVLVGKITPKGETEQTPEERLLQAIFGEKAKDVKDTSLKLPGGEGGKVIDVQIFSKENGDELGVGVIRKVRIYVAQIRKLQVGDKMAGRHGNKGVVSKIVPSSDMPFLEDGTPVDIILNPLGVSSRMNIGQILETHLGMAAKKMGVKIASPALDGIKPDVVQKVMVNAGLPADGKFQLYDGFTGEPFAYKTTVGITYMMKLHHLIEDKLHARSVGPYSLVTQQPLGGKAQHGGQRFGEMEVWALEGYGASNILQEMLTIKSDDVLGRARAYEDIVKLQEIRKPSIPESFNVLAHELQALGLNVELGSPNGEEIDLKDIEEANIKKDNDEIIKSEEISDLTDKSNETDQQIEENINHG